MLALCTGASARDCVSVVFSLSLCSIPSGIGDPDLGVTCVGLESEAKPQSVNPICFPLKEKITPDDASDALSSLTVPQANKKTLPEELYTSLHHRV